MKNLKSESGITLIVLIVIIIVMSLLIGMVAYNVNNAVSSSKLTAFATELKIMQAQVDTLHQKMIDNNEVSVGDKKYRGEEIKEIGQSIENAENASKAFEAEGIPESEQKNYKYYDKQLIKNLGVEGVDQDLLINIEKRNVLSHKGIEYKGKTYYALNSLPNVEGLYNVEHQDFEGKPTFEVAAKQVSSEGKWEVNVSNIQYEGYIKKWNVKYKEAEEEDWNSTEKTTFTIDKHGTYKIKLVNENVESDEIEFTAEYKVMPEILEGMEAISYDESNNNEEKVVENPNENEEWFSYVVNEDDDMSDGGTTNGGKSKWANAKYKDNYFVWIPRYAYKENEDVTFTDKNGNTSNAIDLKFIETSITAENVESEVGEGYKIPDAFSKEEKELAGIWIGKYGVKDVIEGTDQVSEGEHEVVSLLTRSPYGRNGTAIPQDEVVENPDPAMPTPEPVPEEQKTTTGNKYGIYNFEEGYIRIYLKS